MAIQQHRAGLRVVEARQHADERGLATARTANDSHRLPRMRLERNALQHLALVRVVSEAHVAELHLAHRAGQRALAALVFNGRVEHLDTLAPAAMPCCNGPNTCTRRRNGAVTIISPVRNDMKAPTVISFFSTPRMATYNTPDKAIAVMKLHPSGC